jgi:D-cysteine desulfhydrase family pyridoxal phosphate-dependent enzyme
MIFSRRLSLEFYLLLSFLLGMSSSRGHSCHHGLLKRFEYTLPSWAEGAFANPPKNGRLHLGNFPTPLYKQHPTTQSKVLGSRSVLSILSELDIGLYVKRDDMSGGCETSGNKIRKLEFLLADALATNCRSVITIGGEQSNHCRATAAACRMLGLEPHLILRTSRANDIQAGNDDIGFVGNILFDRTVGSQIYTCTPGEYGRLGSVPILARLARYLEEMDPENKVYRIPVGGSNGLGTYGYLQAVDETLSQWYTENDSTSLDHVVFACGSGGTACGLAIGMALAHGALGKRHALVPPKQKPPKIHAVGVCDSPDYFYSFVADICDEMGLTLPDGLSTESFVRENMFVHSGKGLGYALSTKEELDFVSDFAQETGVSLDPVYSGKAMYHFMSEVLAKDPGTFRRSNILFVHTGGALGLFQSTKGDNFVHKLQQASPVKRLDIYGKDLPNGVDISRPVET